MSLPPFLDALHTAAEAVEQEEAAYRSESRRRLEALERGRAHAFRRYNLLKDMVAAGGAPEPEPSIAAQLAVATAETGWSEARAGHAELLEQLRPVAALIHAELHPPPGADDTTAAAPPAGEEAAAGAEVIAAAFAAFEHWYRDRFGQDFLDLLGREAPSFQPLVDF